MIYMVFYSRRVEWRIGWVEYGMICMVYYGMAWYAKF